MIERYSKEAYQEAKNLIWQSNLGKSEKIFMYALIAEARKNYKIINNMIKSNRNIKSQDLQTIPEIRKLEGFYNYMMGVLQTMDAYKGE